MSCVKMSADELSSAIVELKRKKNAVILAHYYTLPEVQRIADFIGDSLALSQEAATTRADIIVFAGVHFMGETAKILSPGKKVLLPDPQAGCSLADSCPSEQFERFCKQNPDYTVVSYVNTTAEIKALTDICCTSSNALRIIESIPADKPVIFAPDRNLGAYIIAKSGRNNILLWDGACHVHERFSPERIREMKAEYPDAKVAAHPECRKEVLDLADFIGSTSAIIDFCGRDDGHRYLVVTEPGILYQMRVKYPGKEFIPVPAADGAPNECEYMKMVTLEKILKCLQDEAPEVILPEPLHRQAYGSIETMLKLSK